MFYVLKPFLTLNSEDTAARAKGTGLNFSVPEMRVVWGWHWLPCSRLGVMRFQKHFISSQTLSKICNSHAWLLCESCHRLKNYTHFHSIISKKIPKAIVMHKQSQYLSWCHRKQSQAQRSEEPWSCREQRSHDHPLFLISLPISLLASPALLRSN